jgi:hypothetical protein
LHLVEEMMTLEFQHHPEESAMALETVGARLYGATAGEMWSCSTILDVSTERPRQHFPGRFRLKLSPS